MTEKKRTDTIDEDCLDPKTGHYLAFEGTVSAPCPDCGCEITVEIDVPTNRIGYICSVCEGEGEMRLTLTPDAEWLNQRSNRGHTC